MSSKKTYEYTIFTDAAKFSWIDNTYKVVVGYGIYKNNKLIFAESKIVDKNLSVQEAEMCGVLFALKTLACLKLKGKKTLFTDCNLASKLAGKQLKQKYWAKHRTYIELLRALKADVEISWIGREFNKAHSLIYNPNNLGK